jgi:ABC-2 type transport system permease protein
MTVNPRRDLGLVLWQIRYEQRAYWRNRQRGIFTFVFPLMFMVIFGSIYKGQTISYGGGRISEDIVFIPGILAYGVITTTYVNMAIGTSILRDQGVLKRMQGTPLPRWAYIASRIGSTVVIVLIMTLLMLILGRVAYSVPIRVSTLPALVVTLILGTAAFTTLGIGITRFIRTAEAAPVVVNLSVLPLSFISDIWFQANNLPKGLNQIANFFPMRPFARALQHAFNPDTTGAGFVGKDLRTLAIWTVVGCYLMYRTLQRPEGDRR